MGSFNISCFASRQTIAPGDPCVIIPIAQSSTFTPVQLNFNSENSEQFGYTSSACYPNRFWTPVASPMNATYEDYGCVSLADDADTRRRLKYFIAEALHCIPSISKGENQYHDLGLNLREFMAASTPALLAHFDPRCETEVSAEVLVEDGNKCWDEIANVTFKHRVFWCVRGDRLRPFAFAVMHKSAYDALLAKTEAGQDWRGDSLARKSVFDRVMADVLVPPGALKTEGAGQPAVVANSRGESDSMTAYRLRNAFCDVVGSPGSGFSDVIPMEVALAEHLLGQSTVDELFAEISPMLADRYVLSAMAELNLHYEPMVLTGQDYDNEVGRNYSQFVAQVSRDVTRARTIHSYGEFRGYTFDVSSPAVFDMLAEEINEGDAAIELLRPAELNADTGRYTLTVETTADVEELLDFFKAMNEVEDKPGEIFAHTLTSVPLNA